MYNFKLIPLNAKICSIALNISSCIGRITILSNNTTEFFNSSALELNPVLVAIPKIKGDVTVCPNIILRIHSSLKNWYWSAASFKGISSTVVLLSALSLNATITFCPLDPVNLPNTLREISSCCSSVGIPLLKLTTFVPENPFCTSLIR